MTPVTSPSPIATTTTFEINVAKETFKFNAAHFVAYPGFRERLHGHNYQVSLRLLGSRTICNDGYLLDFGDVKKVVKDCCGDLNEYFLCPSLSDVIQVSIIQGSDDNGEVAAPLLPRTQETVKLVCEDGATFLFPRGDCLMLPIVHATTEELAIYLWGKILAALDVTYLRGRGIHTLEVTVAEAPGQSALFRMEIPQCGDGSDGGGGDGTDADRVGEEIAKRSDVRRYISSGSVVPRPCLPIRDTDGMNVLQTSAKAEQKERLGDQGGATCLTVEQLNNKSPPSSSSSSPCCSNCETALTKQLQELINTIKDSRMMDESVGDSVEKLQDVIDNQKL